MSNVKFTWITDFLLILFANLTDKIINLARRRMGEAADADRHNRELALETLPGSSLQLTGTGQWVGSRLRFTGEARTAPQHANALNNLLNIIGRRSGDRSLISLG